MNFWYNSFVLENLSSEQFNLIEGCFWISLGVVCIILYFKTKSLYKKLALFSAFILITFGVSDFVQVALGSFFEPGMYWLYIWKIANVIGLISIVGWYLILRLRS